MPGACWACKLHCEVRLASFLSRMLATQLRTTGRRRSNRASAMILWASCAQNDASRRLPPTPGARCGSVTTPISSPPCAKRRAVTATTRDTSLVEPANVTLQKSRPDEAGSFVIDPAVAAPVLLGVDLRHGLENDEHLKREKTLHSP